MLRELITSPTLVTIVTGGGRGIGRSIAVRMSEETAVLLVGRTESDLKSACADITRDGGTADYCVADISDPTAAARVIARAKERGWTVRNLVCNAGIGKGGPVSSFSPEVWRQMFDVNVHGTFYFVQACLPEMIREKAGSISIISSVAGITGFKNEAGYSATKFALNGFAQALAGECKKHGITVSAICPGYVQSDMTERSISGLMRFHQLSRDEAIARIAAQNAQKRILAPAEVAEAVAFVASGAAFPKSGQPLLLTGDTDARVLTLVNWIRKTAASAKGLLIPVSGGSDSTLALKLSALAYPEKTFGIYVGERSQLRCADYLESVAKIEYITPLSTGTGNAEIDRWAQFLAMSLSRRAWLVGTRNHTEELIGLYSLASRLATYLPLVNVWKSEVMELCSILGVPAEITDSSRKADPDCGRDPELAEIPLEQMDSFMQVHEGILPGPAIDHMSENQKHYLQRLVDDNHFKQFLPTTGPRLTPR